MNQHDDHHGQNDSEYNVSRSGEILCSLNRGGSFGNDSANDEKKDCSNDSDSNDPCEMQKYEIAFNIRLYPVFFCWLERKDQFNLMD